MKVSRDCDSIYEEKKEKVPMSNTKRMADYILSTKYEDLPAEVVDKIKLFILDEIGNALGGSRLRSGKIIIDWGKAFSGVPEATIFSNGTKVPISIASGVNTQLCMGLELMETYRNRCHPGSGMVMTALGFGEKYSLSGKKIINAINTAYNVTGRIIDATWPTRDHRERVWNQPYQGCGPLVVAMKLMELNAEESMHAFGMGLGNGPTMNAHNILYVPASMSKCANQFHCFVSINAAVLAKNGYTGYHEILDDPYGFWSVFSDRNRKEIYKSDFDKIHYILTSMSFKPWPTCRWAQPGIQSLLEIMKAQSLHYEDIVEIIFHSHEKITNYPYDNTNPLSQEDAYWSVPWAFAAAAMGYKPGPSWYKKELLKNNKFKQFMQKVHLKTLPAAVEAFEKEPEKSVSLLEVKSENKKSFNKMTEYCKGDPQMPISRDEILDKFLSQAEGVIEKKKISKIIDLISDMENVKDCSRIIELVH
jgi:2-methylcitrate dehydratase PrpD